MNERSDCPSSSTLDRLVECSASHNMGILAQDWDRDKGPPSEDAQFGLNVHRALQQGSGNSLSTDEERMAFSIMHRQKHHFISGWRNAGWTEGQKEEELTEHRMWMHHGIVPVFTGCADYILIIGNRALIIDYKSLWNKVAEPADNHQLRSLATLLWLSRPGLKQITIQIIASHYSYAFHTMDEAELRSYLRSLESIVKQVNQANAPVAGDWCHHCRALLICPAVRKKASDLLKSDEDGNFASRLPKGKEGAKILDDMIAVSSLVDKVKEHYKTVLLEDPKAIPNWVLQTKVSKKFKDTGAVFRMLQDKFQASVFNFIDISVPRAFSSLNSIEQQTLKEYVEETRSTPWLRKKKDIDDKDGP